MSPSLGVMGMECSTVSDSHFTTWSGPDPDRSPTDYIGTWPEKKTVTVAHQGTDPTQL